MTDPLLLALAPILCSDRVSPSPVRRPGPPQQAACHRGHPLSGRNLIAHGRHRRCRACKNARARHGTRQNCAPGYRKNAVGVLLARGPLDYDVPVTVRCGACGNVYETTLGEMGGCPHCRRIAA
jgi:hypothetical protein